MRFGVCCGAENLGVIKAAGYDYIELNFSQITQMSEEEFCSLEEKIKESGVFAETYNCFFPGEIKLVGDSVDYDVIKAHAQKGFGRAARLGGKVAVLGSGGSRRIPDGFDRKTAEEQFVKVLDICGDAASAVGMKLAVEPLRATETNLVNTVDEGMELCRRANHPAVGCLADFFHVHMSGEGLEAIENAGDMLLHTHLARPDPDRHIPTIADLEGCKPWAEALEKCGYTGRMSLEGGFEPDFAVTIEEVKPVLELFRNI